MGQTEEKEYLVTPQLFIHTLLNLKEIQRCEWYQPNELTSHWYDLITQNKSVGMDSISRSFHDQARTFEFTLHFVG